jgi:hypothetical protein
MQLPIYSLLLVGCGMSPSGGFTTLGGKVRTADNSSKRSQMYLPFFLKSMFCKQQAIFL